MESYGGFGINRDLTKKIFIKIGFVCHTGQTVFVYNIPFFYNRVTDMSLD